MLDRRLLALDDQRTSLQAQLDQFCQLVTRQPGLELAQSGRGLATGRGRDFLVASVELASQLGQLVLEPLPLPFGFGLVEAQHIAHAVGFDLADLFSEQLQLQHPFAQAPPNLGIGQRRDVAQPGLPQRLLALALDHPAVADEDQLLDSELLFDDADLIRHGRRIVAVAGKHPHRQRLALVIGQQSDHNLLLAALAVAIVAVLAQRVVQAFEVRAGDVVEQQAGRGSAALEVVAV